MGRRRIVLLVLGGLVVCPLFAGTVLVQRRAAQERMEVRGVLERLEIERSKAEAERLELRKGEPLPSWSPSPRDRLISDPLLGVYDLPWNQPPKRDRR